MNKLTKTVLGGVVGAAAGAGIGALVVPINMFLDAHAPISYPICGALGSLSMAITLKETHDVTLTAMGASGFFLGALACIPLAPVLMATRPVTSPVAYGLLGAIVGGFVGREIGE